MWPAGKAGPDERGRPHIRVHEGVPRDSVHDGHVSEYANAATSNCKEPISARLAGKPALRVSETARNTETISSAMAAGRGRNPARCAAIRITEPGKASRRKASHGVLPPPRAQATIATAGQTAIASRASPVRRHSRAAEVSMTNSAVGHDESARRASAGANGQRR